MIRRLCFCFGFLGLQIHANTCAHSVRVAILQHRALVQVRMQGRESRDSVRMQHVLEKEWPTSDPQALIRLTFLQPTGEDSYWLALSIWGPSLQNDGQSAWAPCWDQWLWHHNPSAELIRDSQILIQQLHNHLRIQNDETASGATPCPVPGFCPNVPAFADTTARAGTDTTTKIGALPLLGGNSP